MSAVGDIRGGWRAAIQRGVADADLARAGVLHHVPAPSAMPYFDRAMAGGMPAEWGIDLTGARPLTLSGFQRLLAAGVAVPFAAQLNAAGDILTAQVDLARDGSFAIGGPDGRLLLVVRDAIGVPVDVLAFRIDAPREIACFFGGSGSGMLGAFNLPRWPYAGRAVLVESPLDWLRSGGNAVCIYDWAAALPILRGLGEAVTIEAVPALASTLRARLERGGLPLVASAAPEGAKLSLAERIGLGGATGALGRAA